MIRSHNEARAPIHVWGRGKPVVVRGRGEGGRGYDGEILMLAHEHKSLYILVTHIKPALEE